MQSHFLGINVTNCTVLNEDEVLCSLQSDDCNKLVVLNLDTLEVKIVIDTDVAIYFLGIGKIPSSDKNFPYFILHTGKGISIVNTDKSKCYDLAATAQANFNVCRSISIQPMDPDDPDQGFWLTQIDNGSTMRMGVKAFDFDAGFMRGLKKLNETAAEAEPEV